MKNDSASSTTKKTEILIVEDSLTQATQLRHLLENNHYIVSVVQNGKQAMDQLLRHKPSLVISDIVMPEMNGYELCKRIKSNKNTEDIPVILLTILTDPEEIIEGLSCGADSFITKPYNENHLLSNITKFISDENRTDQNKVPFGVQILYKGEKRLIQAEQQNVINLVLSIYEGAILQNEKLIQTQEELRLLNERLESLVEDRTADLYEEIKLSNQIANRLKESEEKYRRIFEDHSAVKLLIDPDTGDIIDANNAAADYYGWSCEELKRMKIQQLNISDPEEIKKNMDNVRSQKRTQFEFRHRRKNGSIRDVEVFSSKIKIGNKDLLHSIIHDITERKQAEEELIKAKEKAEESDRLKTAFLHNISHEIRTPMNAIVGFSALLGEPGIDTQAQQSYIETIMQSSDHLLSIITDIIDISNIEANLVKIARNGINVNFTLNSIYNQFLPKVGKKKIKLVCETGLSDSDALIIADNTKLAQVLTNLISNAFKFTDHGIIKVGCEQRDKFLEFRVSDTGIGIPEEFHQKIFERFYLVQYTVSRLYEGTGLGLAISKAYIDLMGGKIWLSSEPGKGATFYFTIPYEKQTIASLPVDEKPLSEAIVFPEKKTILVADDIDSNFELVTYFLSGTNTKILRAANGKEAVEKALNLENIDLILMDIKMPEMDGYDAIRFIREANITIPIIVLTAYVDDMERAIEVGCNGFISKPFNKKSLLKVIKEFI
jgi:PAS domain S-box